MVSGIPGKGLLSFPESTPLGRGFGYPWQGSFCSLSKSMSLSRNNSLSALDFQFGQGWDMVKKAGAGQRNSQAKSFVMACHVACFGIPRHMLRHAKALALGWQASWPHASACQGIGFSTQVKFLGMGRSAQACPAKA